MRQPNGVLAGVSATALIWITIALLVLFVGGSECDRAQCNVIGEFVDEKRELTGVGSVLVALLIGTAVGLRLTKRRRR